MTIPEGKPSSYYDLARGDALSLITPEGKRVLDVGCGSGATGKLLKSRGALEVVGIEYQAQAAAQAESMLDRVLTGDVDTLPLDFALGTFDLILCLDVLEHLPNPEETLRRLLPFLHDDGQFLISLPNIRYAGTLKKLIWEADWPRLQSGIFDGTHLRWFTAKSAQRMFTDVGLSVVARRRNAITALAPLLSRFPALQGLLSDWFTVQFLFLTRKAGRP